MRWQFLTANTLLLSWPGPATPSSVALIAALSQRLTRSDLPLIEVVPAFNQLMLQFHPQKIDAHTLVSRVLYLSGDSDKKTTCAQHRLPVCYHPSLAPDLDHVAQLCHLSPAEVSQRHQAPLYQIQAIGFAPGFAYMAELPKCLNLKRKATPSARVPAGAVAIAEQFTAIYPNPSPGGWHIIGQSPIRQLKAIAEIWQVGDHVKYHPISLNEFEQYHRQDQSEA